MPLNATNRTGLKEGVQVFFKWGFVEKLCTSNALLVVDRFLDNLRFETFSFSYRNKLMARSE